MQQHKVIISKVKDIQSNHTTNTTSAPAAKAERKRQTVRRSDVTEMSQFTVLINSE